MSILSHTADLLSLKVIILGQSAVGKSSILIRYSQKQFVQQQPTVAVDFLVKKETCQGQQFKVQLWDTAGQQKYRTIVRNYYSLSKAAIVVFDITKPQSLKQARCRLDELVSICGNDVPKMLLCNKVDLVDADQRQTLRNRYKDQILQMEEQYQVELFEVSARTAENIEEAFGWLRKQLYKKYVCTQKGIKSSFILDKHPQISPSFNTAKNKGCC